MRIPIASLVFLFACSERFADPPSSRDGGGVDGLPLREIQETGGKERTGLATSSVVVTWIDTFDETGDGRSRGTVYVADLDKQGPFGGVSIFRPSYSPANLRALPGDVLRLAGKYVELERVGSAPPFAAGSFLPQFDQPSGTFVFETRPPEPVEVPLDDLRSFATARKWIGSVVRMRNVRLFEEPLDEESGGRATGRVSAPITENAQVRISNELFGLKPGAFPRDTVLSSVTGIVTFFYSIKVAPRSEADLVK